jgi:arylsulfatase A
VPPRTPTDYGRAMHRSLPPVVAVFAALACLPLPACLPAQQPTPNVVLIYGDDIGYGDLGCYGASKIPTPNLDRLAAEGLRFTDGHCTAATCTPSRFSLLTGIHGFRHGIRVLPPDAPLTITAAMPTLPQLFAAKGYDTAVVGKWHLGLGAKGEPVDWNGDVKPGPLELGFGYSFLLPSTNDRVPCVYLEGHRVVGLDAADPLFVGSRPTGFTGTVYPDGKQDRASMTYYRSTVGHDSSVINGIGRIGYMWGGKSALWNDETMADVFVERAVAWLAARPKHQPFFLFFSSQDIHVPRAPHPRFRGKSELGYRGDAMVQLDWATGEILAALDAQGLADDTIVIFSSDNGPVYDDGYEDGTTVPTSTRETDRGHDGSGVWRGGKYQIYEGGTRVPFLLRWPGRVEPGVSDALVNQIDLFASFAALLGTELRPDQGIDSRNTLPVLLGEQAVGLPFMIEEAGTLALREGNWKFIAEKGKQAEQLFDLATDPGEQRDVAAQHAERTAAMRKKLAALVQDERGVRAHG